MSSNKQYIKVLTKDLKHRGYQWKFGLNEIDVFNNTNECTADALYVCEIKDFFEWMTLYYNITYVCYVTIPEDAQIIIMENKIKTNKVILHEPLISLLDFIYTAINNKAYIHHNNDIVLRTAAYNGNLDLVKCLLSHGANIHAEEDYALRLASKNNFLITEPMYMPTTIAHLNGHLIVVI
jgi:hypothetical protein